MHTSGSDSNSFGDGAKGVYCAILESGGRDWCVAENSPIPLKKYLDIPEPIDYPFVKLNAKDFRISK